MEPPRRAAMSFRCAALVSSLVPVSLRTLPVFLRAHADSLFYSSPGKRNDDDGYLIKFLFRHKYKHVKAEPRLHTVAIALCCRTIESAAGEHPLNKHSPAFRALYEHGSRINGCLCGYFSYNKTEGFFQG